VKEIKLDLSWKNPEMLRTVKREREAASK